MASPHCSWLLVTSSLAIAPLVARAEVSLKSVDVDAIVRGNIAHVTVHHLYSNGSSEPADFNYRFPLPHDAALHDMSAQVSGRRLRGAVMEKQAAARAFEDAAATGKTTTLLEQHRTNDFQQHLANIPPTSQFEVTLSYLEFLEPTDGTYGFRFPMSALQRYGEPIATRPARATGPIATISLDIDAGMALHDFQLSGVDEWEAAIAVGASTALVRSPSFTINGSSGDIIASFRAGHADQVAAAPIVATVGGDGYFQVVVQAPLALPRRAPAPRDVVFVLDTSGSMAGPRLDTAIKFMQETLSTLNDGDTFQIHSFSDSSEALFTRPVAMDSRTRRLAQLALEELTAGGGTNLGAGVDAALSEPVDGDRQRVIFLVTDGEISGERGIIESVGLHQSPLRRFCYVGVGHKRNDLLSSGVAAVGGGYTFWAPAPADAAGAAAAAIATIDGGAIEDVSVDWEGIDAFDVWPMAGATLWPGKTISIAGRFAGEAGGRLHLTGMLDGEEVSISVPLVLGEDRLPPRVVASIWARRRIEQLEEMALYGDMPEVAEEVLELALQHQVMSSRTSFVLVDEQGAAAVQRAELTSGDLPAVIIEPSAVAGLLGSNPGVVSQFDPVPALTTHYVFRYTDAFSPMDYIMLGDPPESSMRFLFEQFDGAGSYEPRPVLYRAIEPDPGIAAELRAALASNRRPVEAMARLREHLCDYLSQRDDGIGIPPVKKGELSRLVASVMLAHPEWDEAAIVLGLILETRGRA